MTTAPNAAPKNMAATAATLLANLGFLTTGDASATAQISSLLTSRHHPFDLRFGTDLSFGDLRNSSAVLVGAFNNSWTLNMTDNLRFVYESGDSPQMHVQDRFDASRSWWPKSLGEKDSEDYAIVSRIACSELPTTSVDVQNNKVA